MLTAFIVEDEKPATDRLTRLLQAYDGKIKVLGHAGTVKESVTQLTTLRPDLVFMDVKLKDGDCFELLKKLGVPSFDIIFTTAYEKYALQAFEHSAVDYLMKPIDPGKLEMAIEKSKPGQSNKRIEVLMYNSKVQRSINKKISIPITEGYIFCKAGEIVRFEGDGNYCTVFLFDGKRYLVTKTLKYYEEILKEFYFFRTHQSHLVNIAFVEQYIKNHKSPLKLDNGDSVPVSVRRREKLFKFIAENKYA